MTEDSVVLEAPEPTSNWRRMVGLCIGVVVLTFGVFGAWAAYARLDGGATGSGVVAVESYKRTIQHLEGGIVSELLVRDGDVVQQGQILVRLDQTRARATQNLHKQQLVQSLAQEARLVAERDLAESIEFPADLRDNPDRLAEEAMNDQSREFTARRATFETQHSILDTQASQIAREIEAIDVEAATANEQLVFIQKDLGGMRELQAKRLLQNSQVTAMEVELLKLKGTAASAAVERVRAEQRVVETRMKMEQLEDEYRQEASKLLPDLRKAIGDLRQQIIVAEDALKRVDIIAPIAGTVQQLRIFTVGGVVGPGAAIMDIVPETDKLVIRAKISPLDADRVVNNMRAEIRFPSFATMHLTTIMGHVQNISRDQLIDEATGDAYFSAEISVDRSQLPEEVNKLLVAGMPASVVMPTGERTALQYLISPLTERLQIAMREK